MRLAAKDAAQAARSRTPPTQSTQMSTREETQRQQNHGHGDKNRAFHHPAPMAAQAEDLPKKPIHGAPSVLPKRPAAGWLKPEEADEKEAQTGNDKGAQEHFRSHTLQ